MDTRLQQEKVRNIPQLEQVIGEQRNPMQKYNGCVHVAGLAGQAWRSKSATMRGRPRSVTFAENQKKTHHETMRSQI